MQYCYDMDDCIKGGDYNLVFCYFRLRKKSKTKKYGVISSRDADLEMRPLEEEDDEEDVTVFEVNGMTDFRSTAHRQLSANNADVWIWVHMQTYLEFSNKTKRGFDNIVFIIHEEVFLQSWANLLVSPYQKGDMKTAKLPYALQLYQNTITSMVPNIKGICGFQRTPFPFVAFQMLQNVYLILYFEKSKKRFKFLIRIQCFMIPQVNILLLYRL